VKGGDLFIYNNPYLDEFCLIGVQSGLHFVDVLESFSQSYHQSRGAGYDPASWRVIALLMEGRLGLLQLGYLGDLAWRVLRKRTSLFIPKGNFEGR
jgi:hypothetical protein